MRPAPLLFLVLPLVSSASASDPRSLAPSDAVAAYDAGDYAGACRILRALDTAGKVDGPLLYRLHFCLRVENDLEGARRALERAREALESENRPGAPIEVPFYLSNAYTNLGRSAEARAVAEEALERVETGAFHPETAIEWFQVAKLNQDAGRHAKAEEGYRRAVAGFTAGPGRFPGQERWARRFLAEAATARAEWPEARIQWSRVADLDDPSRDDLLELATACARTGAWLEAAEAWRRAEKLDMRVGSDPRYAAALARQAAAMGELPTKDLEGRSFASLDPSELEITMREAASAARAKREEAARRPLESATGDDPSERLASELRAIRGVFVAAGIEYAVRRLPLRETAFRDQYATLVFQESEWELPSPQEPPAE